MARPEFVPVYLGATLATGPLAYYLFEPAAGSQRFQVRLTFGI
ncbi:MAG: hypothetical protein P4L56_26505 [Candidatus Sulfopaludibacter sp.]|nr:hypothetical protein [Candidatus Sulfopaludibacter sp.]